MKAVTKSPLFAQSIQLLFVVAVVVILALSMGSYGTRAPLASAETNFIETSTHGLGILPASCASSPAYYHFHLYAGLLGNVRGFISHPGESEYGANLAGIATYICVTNGSGSSYFVPANTAAEVSAFKAASVPGVSKW